jgi:hypothetical protein
MLEMMVKSEKIEMIQSCKDRLLVLLANVKNTGKITGYGKLVEKASKITVVPN